jgi:hypothetical protein
VMSGFCGAKEGGGVKVSVKQHQAAAIFERLRLHISPNYAYLESLKGLASDVHVDDFPFRVTLPFSEVIPFG